MAGDVQLTALQTKAAPLDYVVPDAQMIRVKSIRGEFVDNGAGGAWLPAVQLISDSGHIIATASDQGSSVAAGGSADASFFPGVKPAAATASGAGVAYAQFQMYSGADLFTVPTGVQTKIVFESFFTSDSTVFATALAPSTAVHNAVGDNWLILRKAGVYRIAMAVEWQGGDFVRSAFISGPTDITGADWHGVTATTDSSVAHGPDGVSRLWNYDATVVIPSGAGATIEFDVQQSSGADAKIDHVNIVAVYDTNAGFTNQLHYP